ncbi:hypothetical protein [Streptomyces sp. TLI_171]|uniref:hypothetical protein n=1 Tax=Streptomyces sp. TLI_171 TaxID=1938859 RepID=UPI0015D56494|nr:hypothetical protein [Streptomyces sp. TLI_171]
MEADRILAELSEAEALLERRIIALMELTEALAADAQPEEPVGPVPVPVVAKEPVAGSVVPGWREGMTVQALAPEYRRLLAVLEAGAGPEGLRAKELAGLLGHPNETPVRSTTPASGTTTATETSTEHGAVQLLEFLREDLARLHEQGLVDALVADSHPRLGWLGLCQMPGYLLR